MKAKQPPLIPSCLLYAVISVVFCAPLFARPDGLGVSDWDQHLFYYGSVLKSVVEYGQLPFWNPWYCGGNVLWQNPQVALLSPVYLLTALMPLQLATKVSIVLHYWIGFVGAHLLLTRAIGVSFLPVVVYLATLTTAAGATAIHLAVGHTVFLPGLYLPLLLFFFLRATKTGAVRDALLAAGVLALIVLNGGVHILPMVVMGIGSFSLLASTLAHRWRPIVLAALFFVAGFSYAAPKLLPVLLFVRGGQFLDSRRPQFHPDRMTVEMVTRTYLDSNQHTGSRFAFQPYFWHEYGNYVGALSVALMVGAVLWVFWNRGTRDRWFGRALAATTILLFALSLGEFSSLAPASLIAYVPFLSSFRIHSRYTIPFVMFAAVTIGWAARAILAEIGLKRSGLRAFIAVVSVLGCVQLIAVNRRHFATVFRETPSFDTTFHLMSGPAELGIDREPNPHRPGSPMLRALMNDQMFYNCYEGLKLKRTADPNHPLVFTNDQVPLFATRFTPNRVEFSVIGGKTPSRVFLNQNFAAGWTSTAGPVTAEPATGRLSVVLAPDQTGRFAFAFVPPGLVPGILCLAVALGVSVLVWNLRVDE